MGFLRATLRDTILEISFTYRLTIFPKSYAKAYLGKVIIRKLKASNKL